MKINFEKIDRYLNEHFVFEAMQTFEFKFALLTFGQTYINVHFSLLGNGHTTSLFARKLINYHLFLSGKNRLFTTFLVEVHLT